MEGLNEVTLFGNIGADPELRVTNGGQAVLKLRLATTTSFLDRNNTKQERTEWHSVSIWGKRGESLAKFLKKGERLLIKGEIRTSSYEKDGEKRYRTEVVGREVFFAGRGNGNGSQASSQPKTPGQTNGNAGKAAPIEEDAAPPDDFDYSSAGDDDIPF